MSDSGGPGDFYRVLGVKYTATQEEIEEAYHKLARELHPDMTGDDEVSTARYMAVNEAYQTLSRPAKREDYNQSIGLEISLEDAQGEPRVKKTVKADETTPAQDMRLLDAKLLRSMREAKGLCRKGSYWEATRKLQKFLKTHPDHPGLRRSLARAAAGRKSYHEAVNHMKVVCKVEYHNPDNFVELAGIYVEAGQLMLAQKALGEAFGWNAEHAGALQLQKRIRELRDGQKPPLQKFISRIGRVLTGKG